MAIPFEALHDTAMRLHGVICFYEDKPVMVQVVNQPDGPGMVEDPNKIHVRNLGGRKWNTVFVGEDAFSYDAPRLGFVSYHGRAVWTYRLSARQQRAGLPRGAYMVASVFDNEPIGKDSVWDNKAQEDMLMNKYPSFAEAFAAVQNGEATSVPFHRDLAVGLVDNRVIMLALRQRLIGTYDPQMEKFVLFRGPDTSYVEKVLAVYNTGVPL